MLLTFVIIFAISGPFEYGSTQPKPTLWVTLLLLLGAGIVFWDWARRSRLKTIISF